MDTNRLDHLPGRYDAAAGRWRDKMRVLGYYDGYLGFLSAPGTRPDPARRVIDIGCGSGAMAEAWVAVNGAPEALILLDPSRGMLDRAAAILEERGVVAQTRCGYLDAETAVDPADEILAAHVIEHVPDPLQALRDMRRLLRPGGRLRLVLSKPHWCNAIIWLQWRHRTFSQAEARSLLAQAGFRLESEYAFPSGPPSRTSRGFVAVAI